MLTALVALAVTSVATPAARAIAKRTGWLDVPNARSSHLVPTPRTGGLAIVIGAGIAIVAGVTLDAQWHVMLSGVAAMTIMGAIDDVRALPPALRLVVQCVVAVGVVTAGHLSLPPAGAAWAIALTVFWIVGTTNAYNFMDGINGIAGTQAVIAAAALAWLALQQGDIASAGVFAALGGAAAGFLPWNVPRASIFMGDAGSATLGFAFGAVIVRLTMSPISFVAAALPLAPFLLDTSVTLLLRARRREPLLAAHRSHFYQRMVALGFSHVTTTTVWSLLAAASAGGALAYDAATTTARGLILLAVALAHAAVAAFIITGERASGPAGIRSRVREAK